jgi:WD40 repeat protein
LSPDGKFVVAGLADNSLRLFDVAMGKEIKNLTGHAGAVTAVEYTAKGDLFVSASADKTIHFWNAADGADKGKLENAAAVNCLALSKDGAKVVAGLADKSIKVWTLADSKAAQTFATPAEVKSIGFNPAGDRLIVGGADKKARIYTLDGKLVEFFEQEGPIVAAAFHADGKQVLIAGADKTPRIVTTGVVWQAEHAGPVRRAAFSPKGDRIVSAGDDKTVKIWNPADGKLIKSLAAHDGPATGVGISADGLKIVSIGADKTVKLFTLGGKDEDKPTSTFTLTAPAQSVAISANGARVAVGVTEGKEYFLRVFDLAAGKELVALSDHAGAIGSLTFLADNRTLVSGSADKTARLTDVNVLSVFDGHAGGVSSVAFNAQGNQALTGGADKTVKLWDLATLKPAKTFGPLDAAISSVAYNRDFTQVGASIGKTVKVWNIADGKEALTLTHPADVLAFSVSVDKTKIVTGAADNQARVWDVATGKEIQGYPHSAAVRGVAFLPDNVHFLSTADKTPAIQTVSVTRTIAAAAVPIHGLALTPNASHVLTASDDKTVKLWNVASGAKERDFGPADGAVTTVAVSKNNILVATGGAEGLVRVYQLADAKLIDTFKAPGAVNGLAFTPNSLTLAAACADKSVIAWNVTYTPGQPKPEAFGKAAQTNVHAAAATDVVFANDTTLYSASQDKTAKAWKFASDAATKSFQHPNLVDAVAFNSAGTQLATGCHDGSVRIWDIAKGMVLKEIKAHAITVPTPQPAAVYCLAWTSDGKQVISGGLDGSAKLWDATAGTLVKEFKAYNEKDSPKGHREAVFCVALSPDGKTLATGSSDHSVKLWNVADGTVKLELANSNLKGTPTPSHPGWVYGVRFTNDGKFLVSVGSAPQNKGSITVWNAADGKLLYSEDTPGGTIYSVAISKEGKLLALGAGATGRANNEPNTSYIIKMPEAVK